MRRTWVWVLVAIGAASLAVLVASLRLGLEELSWVAGTGSFVLTAATVALAWPRRAPSSPGPAPSSAPPVPGWVQLALPAGQADAHELGAHDALPGPSGEGLPPYVVRDVDDELDRRLAEAAAAPRGGLVLVAGASTAGKTRALAQALARTLPGRMLISPPEDADLRPLPAWLKQQAERAPQGWVVWLDDLDRHLAASGLTPALVAELGHAGAVVAATIRQERLDALRPSATDPAPGAEAVGYAVLKTPPITVRRDWSRQERDRARTSGDERLVQAADDEGFGVAEQLAAGPHLQQDWENGPDSGYPRGYALVAAAVGLDQAGVSSPLTREQLQTAHTAYLPAPPPLPEEVDQAWEWATRPRSGQAGLLVPADHEGRRWRAFDYLTTSQPLPDAVWRTALDAATGQDRFTIASTAYHAKQFDIAETAWHAWAKQSDTDARSGLRVMLLELIRAKKAEDRYRKAAEQGDIDAMANLGILLDEAGQVGEAETWLREAAKQDNTHAMFNLARLLAEEGRFAESEFWRQRAQASEETD